MKMFLLFLASFFSIINTQAEIPLKENFCAAIPTSKRYINPNFEEKYPKTITFECTYKCNSKGQIDKIQALSVVISNSMTDDALTVVCQGIKLKAVPWGYEFDKAEPFYAYETKLENINEWAFQHIDKNNNDEKLLLLKLKEDLLKVSSSFEATKAPTFLEASIRLRSIANELPEKTIHLNKEVNQIIIHKGQIDQNISADSLVQKMLLSLAYFRIPSYQF